MSDHFPDAKQFVPVIVTMIMMMAIDTHLFSTTRTNIEINSGCRETTSGVPEQQCGDSGKALHRFLPLPDADREDH